jgi:hypothetical protein
VLAGNVASQGAGLLVDLAAEPAAVLAVVDLAVVLLAQTLEQAKEEALHALVETAEVV